MRKILVTAISGDIGNGILKVLKETDSELYGCDVNQIAVGMDLVNEFRQCRFAMDEGYVEELLDFCHDRGIEYVIPVNEREIERLSVVRNRFHEAGTKLVIQPEDVLDICLDKYKTAAFLRKNGLDVPDHFMDADTIDPDTKYICKPCRSNGSKEIRVDFGREFKRTGVPDGFMLQEYIDSDEEYTVGIFREGDISNVIAFRRQLKHGYSYLVELVSDERLTDLANRIADLFHLRGYINIQLRRKEKRDLIFEINPRISGTVRFRHMLGFRDVLWWLDMLDGKEAKKYICNYAEAVGIRELNEKFLTLVEK